ncbi:ribose 5-phosphate isomerase A-domain-containing protein [Gilbertella persicaria]|nr:ribose 5-phosphate isomerase A-domain-containing protein [Gilbertella persicaria]KAI8072259.1 ribose 5-phosphate isomerase A-domain-containing protein [Gilbertella persicaria]
MNDIIQANPSIIGVGSGSTIVYAIERLAGSPLGRTAVCIPTSFQTRELILRHKLNLGSIEQYPYIDITVDGADEVDPNLNAIKGGGACLFQERLIAQASHRFVLVADARKKSSQLGTQWKRGVPVEVVPIALSSIHYQLERLFPTAKIQLRMASPTDKAGPVVTDNGNLLLDCDFGPIQDPDLLYKEIKCLTGVFDVGLFCHMADTVYYGSLDQEDGEIISV